MASQPLALAMPSTRSISHLDKLPDELLCMVIGYFGDESHLPKKSRVTFILSLVNRRLRALAIPLLYQHVPLSYRQFEYLQRLALTKENNYASYIRYCFQFQNITRKRNR